MSDPLLVVDYEQPEGEENEAPLSQLLSSADGPVVNNDDLINDELVTASESEDEDPLLVGIAEYTSKPRKEVKSAEELARIRAENEAIISQANAENNTITPVAGLVLVGDESVTVPISTGADYTPPVDEPPVTDLPDPTIVTAPTLDVSNDATEDNFSEEVLGLYADYEDDPLSSINADEAVIPSPTNLSNLVDAGVIDSDDMGDRLIQVQSVNNNVEYARELDNYRRNELPLPDGTNYPDFLLSISTNMMSLTFHNRMRYYLAMIHRVPVEQFFTWDVNFMEEYISKLNGGETILNILRDFGGENDN